MLAGSMLVTVGIVCLYLSGAVERTGSWWQGTLDAFGVGFVVGGVVDVISISLLNQILNGFWAVPLHRRRDANMRAQWLLSEWATRNSPELSEEAEHLLFKYADRID